MNTQPKNQDTQPEWETRFDTEFLPDGVSSFEKLGAAMLKDFIRQEIAAAEERGREQGRGEMIRNSEGFIQTALLPASAIAAAERGIVERVLQEMPDGCDYYTCDRGDCLDEIKQELRAKYLTSSPTEGNR